MKKNITLILACFISLQLFSQSPKKPSKKMTYSKYIEKSEKQMFAGTALLIAGSGLMLAGGFVALNDWGESFSNAWNPNAPEVEDHSNLILKLEIIGGASIIAGSIFLSRAKLNKQKAITIDLNDESVHLLQSNKMVYSHIPAIRLRWRF